MASYFRRVEHAGRFDPAKPVKQDLFAGSGLFVGLNCFEPGQNQPSHVHEGADKFYLVLAGRARIRVGDEAREVDEGNLIWAPAGLTHGVEEVLERTVLLVAIAPPPMPKQKAD